MSVYDDEWKSLGNCVGKDTRIFFDASRNRKVYEDRMRQICEGCPVRSECLEWALVREEFGSWGGMTEKELADIRRERGTHVTRNTYKNQPSAWSFG